MSTKNPLAAVAILTGILMVPSLVAAQDTSAGTLTVTATIDSSISLTFESDGAGVPLTGAGTNAATLAFGTIQAFGGVVPAGVTRTASATDFTVSSPFGVQVVKANSASANYTLAAALGTADTTNTWEINGTSLSTTPVSLGNTFAYGAAQSHTLALTIPVTSTAAGITNTVDFTATAN